MREKHLAGTPHATTPTSNTFTSQRIPSSFLAQIATARQQMTGAGQGTVAEAPAIHTLDQRMREKHLAGTPHTTTPTSNTFTSQRIPSSFVAQIATARQQMTRAGQGTVAEGRDEFQKVQHRIKEAKYKMMAAHTTPSRLGEDLHKAIDKGSLKDVRRHLDAGADVNYLTSEGITPLQRALTIPQREDMVALLWKRGADLDAVNDNGNSAMHVAVWYDFSGRCVSLLISGRGDVNARCARGMTPLHWAAHKSNEAAVEALLAAGAKKDLKPWDGPWTNKIPFDLAKTPQIRNLLRL
ncbi:hypothetical protein R5R35_013211 [Gryllus longicercus]